MKVEAVIQRFADLTEVQQAIVLARFAYELTIVAREAYPIEGKPASSPFTTRDINELQHRVTAAVVDRLTGNRKRYPDEILVRMCADPNDNPLALSGGPVLTRLLAEAGLETTSGGSSS